jgi:hypothetical protein
VWILVAAGIVVRVVLAFTTDGQPFDMESLRLQRIAIGDDPLHAYEALNSPEAGYRFPYPPGFLAFVALAGGLSDLTGLAFTSLVRLPSVLADGAIALIVHDHLRRRGAAGRTRIAAVALVALGPSFIAISGYHGQIDSLAILPGVAALWVWMHGPQERRALYAGALIGVGIAIKTAPVFLLLALLPAVRSRREAVVLVAAAVAIPAAVTAPFLIATYDEVRRALGYRGFPGTSGLSLLLQPELAEQINHPVDRNGAVDFIYEKGQWIVALALAGVAAFARRRSPLERAVLIWIAFYCVTPTFFVQYLVWGLPFFVMAGRLRLALAVQAIAIVPTIVFYRAPWEASGVDVLYGATMIALWLLFVASFVVLARERTPVA